MIMLFDQSSSARGLLLYPICGGKRRVKCILMIFPLPYRVLAHFNYVLDLSNAKIF